MLLTLAVLGASAQAAGCNGPSAAAAEVRAVAMGIIAADNGRDLGRVLGYYAKDAILLPPGEAPVVGRDAIRPRYELLFDRFNPAIEGRLDEICVGGRIAFVRGHNGGRLVSRGSGADRELDDVYVMLFRQEEGGVWRISRLIWHRASPATPVRR